MFIHRPTRRFRKSVAGTTLAAAETTGLSVKGAKVFALEAAQAYCPQYVTSS